MITPSAPVDEIDPIPPFAPGTDDSPPGDGDDERDEAGLAWLPAWGNRFRRPILVALGLLTAGAAYLAYQSRPVSEEARSVVEQAASPQRADDGGGPLDGEAATGDDNTGKSGGSASKSDDHDDAGDTGLDPIQPEASEANDGRSGDHDTATSAELPGSPPDSMVVSVSTTSSSTASSSSTTGRSTTTTGAATTTVGVSTSRVPTTSSTTSTTVPTTRSTTTTRPTTTTTRPETTTTRPTTTTTRPETTTTQAPTTTTRPTTTAGPTTTRLGSNLVVNGSFEQPNLLLGNLLTPAQGWSSSASNLVEVWVGGFLGVDSSSGRQHAELNVIGVTTYSQTVAVDPGSTYRWSFDHRGRIWNESVEVLIDGVEVGTFTSGTSWQTHRGEAVARSSTMTFAIRSVLLDPSGNMIDAVELRRVIR